ncbi:hypothetical protein [Streptomyces decoyicus]
MPEPGVRNPDFLVSREGERFAIEAIWSAQRLADMGEQIPPPLIDAIDNVPSPNFFLSYSVHEIGAAAPSQKRLKNGLVVRGLAGIRPRPELGHPSLPRRSVDWSLQTTTPTCPYEAISVRSSQ